MLNHTAKLSLLLLSAALPTTAKTLLFDVNPVVPSTAADFAAYDPNVDTSAPVATTSTGAWTSDTPITITDEDGTTYTAYTSTAFAIYAAGADSWTDGLPILDGYHYHAAGKTVTITGLSAFTAGDIITLTCFGVGDNTNQGATFTPTYGSTTLPGQGTTQGTVRGTETNSIRSVQFQFTADGVTDELSFAISTNLQSAKNTTFNGFSITTAPPTFGDVTAATLSTTGNTLFLEGDPTSVQLTATGTFTTEGQLDVTTLGPSVVVFNSSDPNVVSVTQTGLVTLAGSPGTSDVTATIYGDNGTQITSAPITFTVETPTSITVTAPDPVLLTEGFSTDVSATANSASLSNVPIEGFNGFGYMTSNPFVASVDFATGVVTPEPGGGPGIVTITASLAGTDGSTDITVEAPVSITATPTTNTLFLGGRDATINVTVDTASLAGLSINSLGNNGTLTFTPLTSGIVDAGVTGLVTPVSPGSVDVEVDFEGLTTTVSFDVSEAPVKPANLIHRYSFTGTPNGTVTTPAVIPDEVGTADATVVGTGAVFDSAGTSLILPGGADTNADITNSPAYVDLPNGIISTIPSVDVTGLSFEVWMTVDATNSWTRVFDFGNSTSGIEDDPSNMQTSTLDLIARRSQNGHVYTEFTLSRPAYGTQALEGSAAMDLSTPSYLVLTIDPEVGSRKLYLDGTLIGSDSLAADNSALSMIDDVNCWLGRSNASDNLLNGSFDEFRIHTGILTQSQINANHLAGPDVIITPGTYTDWATQYAGGQNPDLDYDMDGMPNGVEYLMGETDSPVFTPNPTVINGKVTWPYDPSFSGTYTVQTSTDLVNWTNRESTNTGTTIEFDASGLPDSVFIRLQVTP